MYNKNQIHTSAHTYTRTNSVSENCPNFVEHFLFPSVTTDIYIILFSWGYFLILWWREHSAQNAISVCRMLPAFFFLFVWVFFIEAAVNITKLFKQQKQLQQWQTYIYHKWIGNNWQTIIQILCARILKEIQLNFSTAKTFVWCPFSIWKCMCGGQKKAIDQITHNHTDTHTQTCACTWSTRPHNTMTSIYVFDCAQIFSTASKSDEENKWCAYIYKCTFVDRFWEAKYNESIADNGILQ